MLDRLIFCLLLSGIGLAQADTYRFETQLSYNDTSADFVDGTGYNLTATYYLNPVDNTNGPLFESAFINRSSFILLSHSDSDQNFEFGGGSDALQTALSGRYIYPGSLLNGNGWFVGAGYSRARRGVTAGDADTDSYRFEVGKYLAENTTLSISYGRGETDFPTTRIEVPIRIQRTREGDVVPINFVNIGGQSTLGDGPFFPVSGTATANIDNPDILFYGVRSNSQPQPVISLEMLAQMVEPIPTVNPLPIFPINIFFSDTVFETQFETRVTNAELKSDVLAILFRHLGKWDHLFYSVTLDYQKTDLGLQVRTEQNGMALSRFNINNTDETFGIKLALYPFRQLHLALNYQDSDRGDLDPKTIGFSANYFATDNIALSLNYSAERVKVPTLSIFGSNRTETLETKLISIGIAVRF